MDEKELLRRLKSGDREAQKIFWDLHRDSVYGFIHARSRLRKTTDEEVGNSKADDSDVQDILVSTFVSFFKDIGKFRGTNATMKTWLYGIAKNRIVDFYREEDRQSFENSTSLHNAAARKEDLEEKKMTATSGPILLRTRLHAAENARAWQTEAAPKLEDFFQIKEALDRLPKEKTQIIRLRFLQGHSIKETADITRMSEGAVKMACFRAIKKLQELLKENREEIEEGDGHDEN